MSYYDPRIQYSSLSTSSMSSSSSTPLNASSVSTSRPPGVPQQAAAVASVASVPLSYTPFNAYGYQGISNFNQQFPAQQFPSMFLMPQQFPSEGDVKMGRSVWTTQLSPRPDVLPGGAPPPPSGSGQIATPPTMSPILPSTSSAVPPTTSIMQQVAENVYQNRANPTQVPLQYPVQTSIQAVGMKKSEVQLEIGALEEQIKAIAAMIKEKQIVLSGLDADDALLRLLADPNQLPNSIATQLKSLLLKNPNLSGLPLENLNPRISGIKFANNKLEFSMNLSEAYQCLKANVRAPQTFQTLWQSYKTNLLSTLNILRERTNFNLQVTELTVNGAGRDMLPLLISLRDLSAISSFFKDLRKLTIGSTNWKDLPVASSLQTEDLEIFRKLTNLEELSVRGNSPEFLGALIPVLEREGKEGAAAGGHAALFPKLQNLNLISARYTQDAVYGRVVKAAFEKIPTLKTFLLCKSPQSKTLGLGSIEGGSHLAGGLLRCGHVQPARSIELAVAHEQPLKCWGHCDNPVDPATRLPSFTSVSPKMVHIARDEESGELLTNVLDSYLSPVDEEESIYHPNCSSIITFKSWKTVAGQTNGLMRQALEAGGKSVKDLVNVLNSTHVRVYTCPVCETAYDGMAFPLYPVKSDRAVPTRDAGDGLQPEAFDRYLDVRDFRD